jgi:hypothetical protein
LGGFADGGLGFEERRGKRESEAKKGKKGGVGGKRKGGAGRRRKGGGRRGKEDMIRHTSFKYTMCGRTHEAAEETESG